MKILDGNPSKTGEYNVNGTTVRAIEQKELNNPDIKVILGNRHIEGFPTILIKNKNSFDEYNGSRDIESLRQLFSKPKNPKNPKNPKKMSKKQSKSRERKVRQRKTPKGKKSIRKTRKARKPKPTSWLF